MKKIILTSLLAFAALGAGAQTADDALLFSENEYSGTARTIAMGNAFSALGGDIGSITLNPAGSAVNKYSQFSLTPLVKLNYSYSDINADNGYQHSFYNDASIVRAYPLNNIGAIAYFDTHNSTGLKSITFGFVANMTKSYADKYIGRGINSNTSYMGQLAAGLNGFSSANLDAADAYLNPDCNWREIVGWKSGMVFNLNNDPTDYIGASEKISSGNGEIGVGGPLQQNFVCKTTGSKHDMAFNIGLNFDDVLYVGGNIGITTFEYRLDEAYSEYAENPKDFPNEFENGVTYFDNMLAQYSYKAEGAGVYGKFGVIWVPIKQLRLAFTAQTPTLTEINETWQNYGEVNFTDRQYSGSEKSVVGEYKYNLISPYRLSAGAAVNFGMGVISTEYEMCDYGTMRFRNAYDSHSSEYDRVNKVIPHYATVSHMFRVGTEFRIIPSLAVRAGYSLTTSPIAEYKHDDRHFKHMVSAGIGYNSKGSFYCDAAVACRMNPRMYTKLYDDYIDNYMSPELSTSNDITEILLTLGWRF
ncbi:MAG: hypothetical protein K6C37_00975 [Bacteroidales bacterium]|nr:hypothetical protein [Bacteroidales bacterium]